VLALISTLLTIGLVFVVYPNWTQIWPQIKSIHFYGHGYDYPRARPDQMEII
jgi:hypothetical protein